MPSCDTLTFAKTLASDAAVLVIPGIAFGSAGEGFVRISFAASLDQIGSGIERIGRGGGGLKGRGEVVATAMVRWPDSAACPKLAAAAPRPSPQHAAGTRPDLAIVYHSHERWH